MAVDVDRPNPLQFVFKVTARCNLDCTYCYVFNKADQTWRDRPRVMSDEVFDAAVERIARHCDASGQPVLRLMFHGGEPLLAGRERFARWFGVIRERFGGRLRVLLSIQTNGTLVDARWARLFAEHDVEVGVSIDGPPSVHDLLRVDHHGRGSHEAVVRGVRCLQDAGARFSALCVVQPGADGLATDDHLRSLGPQTVNYLFPDHTHDDIGPVRRRFGPTPVAAFLRPVLDRWATGYGDGPDIPLFHTMARLVCGGPSSSDMFGNPPLGFVFVETDGAVEGLDVLRVDGEGLASVGLHVAHHDFVELAAVPTVAARAILHGTTVPAACDGCPEQHTCGGGYLPHRYAAATGFDNRSAWCADILALFGRLRTLLDVDPWETDARRSVLAELAAEAVPT